VWANRIYVIRIRNKKFQNVEPSIFLLLIFFATQIIGGAEELVVLL
jgi:hypothetical protein